MKILFVLFFSTCLQLAYSQVSIQINEKIEQFVNLRKNRIYNGYRIQIGFSPNRTEIEELRTRFLKDFPEIETNISFEAPYFNLKVGNFRKKIEAEILIEQIQYSYPLSNLLKEVIDMPSIN